MTGWKVAQTIWPDMATQAFSSEKIAAFREVRPALETGYEAILIMRLLQQGHTAHSICENYAALLGNTLHTTTFTTQQLKQRFGERRDQWILDDEADWLSNNPLFSGIAEKLQRLSDQDWYIITTKQERFVLKILEAANIQIDPEAIFGMDRQQSKQQVLHSLLEKHPTQSLIFIEDRLPTLLGVQENPLLSAATLQLVDWGYNTDQDQILAQQHGIDVITLKQLLTTPPC